jgi:carboxyl-terminal processing protease
MNKTQKRLIIPLLLIVILTATAVALAWQRPSKEQVISDVLVSSLTNWHYAPQDLDDEFSKRVFNLYLKTIDYNKRFLLKSDLELLRPYQTRIDDEIKRGTHNFLDFSATVVNRRIAEIQTITAEILKHPFSFTTDESLELDPEKRDYAANSAELKELWRKTLKYQTLIRYIDLISPDDASKKTALSKPFQPELEAQAREYVAKSLKRVFDRIVQDAEDRNNRYLEAVVASFDPHTNYFPPATKADFDIQMSGTLEGIGAVLQEDGEYIKVKEVVPGSPAWRQKGLKAEDQILKVAQGDGEPVEVSYMPVEDVVKLIRGKKGTEVRLTVKKPDGQIAVIPIVREVVIIEETYAKSAIIQNPKTKRKYGYIYLPSFYHDFNDDHARNSADDVRRELEKLKQEKVSGVILDLRNNGGGALEDAINMSGLFIKSGPILQVKDRKNVQVLRDPNPSVTYTGPLVVMINAFSASASEILAAALQDYGRAVIVGSPNSFGKGTVQTLVDLDRMVSNDYASYKPLGTLKLTIQKYYRINGGSTQFKGVISDIPLPDPQNYLDVGEKSLDYPLAWDSVSATQYTKWKPAYNLKKLRQLSTERIKSNPGFKMVTDSAARVKEKQQNTAQSLKLAQILEEQTQLKAESDKLKNLPGEHKTNQVYGIKNGTAAASDPEQAQLLKDWYQQVNSDIYINEATHIINDMSGGR